MRLVSRIFVVVVLAGIGLAAGLALLLKQVGVIAGATAGTQGEELNLQPLPARSVVYARDGSVLATFHAEEDRVPVSLDRVPQHVIRAVLDAEDDRFFEHGAIDVRALTRAMVVNLESGAVQEGGSTITQQLVKVSLLSSRQSADRKLKEAVLAIRLESKMSKNQILERYVNAVYFGNGAYGLQAAAETYFKTDVDKLSVGQGLLLASLIRDPVGSDPWAHPVDARRRRDVVISRMRDLGHITPAQAGDLMAEPLPKPPPDEPAKGSDYFTEHVKQLLLQDPRLGKSIQQRTQAVFKGGLAIHTTLDPADQRAAEQSVAANLPDSGGRFNAAVVSVDPSTGGVRALVGGPDFARSKFNLATDGAGRQPGSSFKPFTLMAALESGFSPNDTILGASPCSIPNPGGAPDPWTPANVEGEAPGVLTLTDATVHSVNCAYARIVKLVGPDKVVDVAKRMGITNRLEPHLSITLGSETVSPLQMASAYSTLAADGEHHAPYFIDRVDDQHGQAIFKFTPKGERVVSAQNARTVTQVLSQVVQRGTGTAAAVDGWTVAGKTGTTDDYTNAWFVGYTPTLATAVWMGSPDGNVPMRSVGGIRVFGGTYPAQIWHGYMAAALAATPAVGFPAPDPGPLQASQYRSITGESSGRQVLATRTFDTVPTIQGPATVVIVPAPSQPAPPPVSPPIVTVPNIPVPTVVTVPRRPRRPRAAP
jgi:penicillin-binding protein 1A